MMVMIPSSSLRLPVCCSTAADRKPTPATGIQNLVHSRGTGKFSTAAFKLITREGLEQLCLSMNVSIKNATTKLLDVFVDSVFEFFDQPLLPSQSNFAAVDEQKEGVNITRIEGEIPKDFPEGVYIRNGGNPLFGSLKSTKSIFGESSQIWVEGDGMLHALYLSRDDDQNWVLTYKNRYIESTTFKLEKRRNRPAFLPAARGDPPSIFLGILLNTLRFGKANRVTSNTNVFEHSGKLYSIAENDLAQEIDTHTLETLDDWTINGTWNRPFTSHPKKAPETGELVIMGVDARKPFLEVGVVSADGNLVHKQDLKLKRCTLTHEIGVTQRYNVIIDHPLIIDVKRLIFGGQLIKFEKGGQSRIGVMPRYGDAESVKWFEVQPSCAFHIINCFEEGDEVAVYGCRALNSVVPGPEMSEDCFEWFSRKLMPLESPDGRFNGEDEKELAFHRPYEWRLNMRTGDVEERCLTGTRFSMDFPTISAAFTGLKNKYGYTQVRDSFASSISGMAKFGGLAKLYFEEPSIASKCCPDDPSQTVDGIKVEYQMLEENTFCSGAAYVPREGGTEEDDGYIITFVHNEDTDISQIYIFDAKDFSGQAVCKIPLPSRVPYGFHSLFVPLK